MTELFEPADARDWRLTTAGPDLLTRANAAGLLTSSDVHVATRVGALGGETDPAVLLALALAVRAVRRGSVCVRLAEAQASAGLPEEAGLAWPEPAAWEAAVAASPLTLAGVLRSEHGLLYLDRYHRLERGVCRDLLTRLDEPVPEIDGVALEVTLPLIRDEHLSPEQEMAVRGALGRTTTVLTGGPGTGKTTTVARALVLLAAQAGARGERVSVALAAPTGKAATRLQEAVAGELAGIAAQGPAAAAAVERVGQPQGVTLHRLLGWRPDNSTRFRHDRTNRLKHDVVVVDECSMVELTLMSRLLEAVRPEARLILAGDPQQLTSVGAGAVLKDLVDGLEQHPAAPVAGLTRNFRSEEDIKALATALRVGDADAVLDVLRSGSTQVQLVEAATPEEVEAALREVALAPALAVRAAALEGRAGDAVAQLDLHRLLCAHREGPFGVRHWNQRVEGWLAEDPAAALDLRGPWYAGRPLLVTRNDYALDVYNGEVGVVVRDGTRLRAHIAGSGGLQEFAPGRLDTVETMHASTIHKAQGSQASQVTVLLPDADSQLLTRELFYTAVTRAQHHVRVVGTEAAVRAAVATRAVRATGLTARLAAGARHTDDISGADSGRSAQRG
ncbi:exodeoxyribonuclease V subunit alpha [Nocardioides nanhaiensis]|uniref:RecBCD enzyme subunit RecD n=1 Tax=Nocardioides nanhaiensis TaxID=1476871 RepID=A0ABP8WCS9_9ACTN